MDSDSQATRSHDSANLMINEGQGHPCRDESRSVQTRQIKLWLMQQFNRANVASLSL